MTEQSAIVLRFSPSRAACGADVGALIREAFPEADLHAELDDAGAVVGYALTVTFADADQATDAIFRLRDTLDDLAITFEIADP